MVEEPLDYLEECKKVGAKRILFHIESKDDPREVIKKCEELGLEKGIAINPEASLESIKPYLGKVDLVLFLGVKPGWQGQGFIPSVLDNIKKLRENSQVKIQVDGGIKIDNVLDIAEAGADYLVVGSAIVGNEDIEGAFNEFNNIVK